MKNIPHFFFLKYIDTPGWKVLSELRDGCTVVRFEVLAVASVKIAAFWDVVLCSLLPTFADD